MEEPALDSLMKRAAAGDGDAVARIVRRYEDVVKAAIHRRLGPEIRARVDTEDIFQSAIVAAVGALADVEYRGERAFVAWLTAVADWRVRKAVAHNRAAKRDPRRERDFEHACAAESPVTEPPLRAERTEIRERVGEAISRLPEPDATVVRLRSFDGLTFAEIARRAGLGGKDEARYVLQRGLRRLGEILEPE